jgi:hypothetical protein
MFSVPPILWFRRFFIECHPLYVCTVTYLREPVDEVWIDGSIYWSFLHHTEIQVITGPLLISTIHRSPQNPNLFPACCVFNSRSLATAFNSGDPSASGAHVTTVWRIPAIKPLSNINSTIAASLQSPLYSSTQLPTLNWTLSLTKQLLRFTLLNWTAHSRPEFLAV